MAASRQASNLTAPIPLGIIAGLFIGKQTGVFAASMLAIRLGLAAMPEGATTTKLYAIAILTGIGFTMSLFIGTLAFDDEAALKQVRLGVLAASLLSGIVAALLFCGLQPIERGSGFAIGRRKRATPAMRSKPGRQPLLVFAMGK